MTDIGPGTPLICVDAPDRYPRNPRYKLTVGAIYFVERTFDGEPWQHGGGYCPHDRCGITFVQLVDRPWGYCPNLFRPLNDGSTDLVDVEQDEQETFEALIAGAAQWGIIIPNRKLKA